MIGMKLIIGTLLLVPLIDSSEIESTCSVSKTSARVAEPFVLTCTVQAPSKSIVEFSSIGSKFGPFDVLDVSDRFGVPSKSRDGSSTWVRRIVLESIETGDLLIPAQRVEIRTKTGFETVTLEAQKIRIESVLENRPDPQKFRDIKGLIDVSVPEHRGATTGIWILSASATVLMLAAAAIAFALRRKQATMPHDEMAILALRCISTNQESPRDCCEQVIDILRNYLAHRWGVARNTGVRDLMTAVVGMENQLNCGESQLTNALAVILKNAEMTKFAARQPGTEELNATVNMAIDFVKRIETSGATESEGSV